MCINDIISDGGLQISVVTNETSTRIANSPYQGSIPEGMVEINAILQINETTITQSSAWTSKYPDYDGSVETCLNLQTISRQGGEYNGALVAIMSSVASRSSYMYFMCHLSIDALTLYSFVHPSFHIIWFYSCGV